MPVEEILLRSNLSTARAPEIHSQTSGESKGVTCYWLSNGRWLEIPLLAGRWFTLYGLQVFRLLFGNHCQISYGLKKFPRHLAYTFQTGIHPSLGSVVVAIEPAVRRIPYGPVNGRQIY